MITISFEHAEHHETCSNLERAEQLLGSVSAGELVRFLSDAAASNNVGDLIDLLGEDIKISGDDSLSVAIGSDYRADLIAMGQHVKRDGDDRVIWTSVIRLKLMAISRVP